MNRSTGMLMPPPMMTTNRQASRTQRSLLITSSPFTRGSGDMGHEAGEPDNRGNQ